MIGTLDTGESATRLAELAVPRLCDWAIVAVVGEDGGRARRAARTATRPAAPTWTPTADGRLRGQPAGRRRSSTRCCTGRAGAAGADRRGAGRARPCPPSEVRAAWRRLDTTSATIVPLRARGETFGALGADERRRPAAAHRARRSPPPSRWPGAARWRWTTRGSTAASSRSPRRCSAACSPRRRSRTTCEIAVRYRPAGRYQQVGGDWYDAFQQPDGATAAGHRRRRRAQRRRRGGDGPDPQHPARHRLRPAGQPRAASCAGSTGCSPACTSTPWPPRWWPGSSSPTERAATGCAPLRWSSAGHLPPLLLQRRRPGARRWTAPPERLLGAELDRPPPRPRGAAATGGHRCCCYTDGLVEHGRTDIDEGIDRLTAVLAELHDAAGRGAVRPAAGRGSCPAAPTTTSPCSPCRCP